MLGILAFGDSITHGGGELQWGVAMQSWALWVARALGLPYSPQAVDGATIATLVDEQIPAFERRAVSPKGPFDVGCVYVGTNDVRGPDWDPGHYAEGLSTALAFVAARCERVVTANLPVDLGRPRAGAAVHEANAAIERAARDSGALLVDLRGFSGRRVLMADHVHPTAFGQIAIAERALALLAADGLPPRVAPSELIVYETTPVRRLRGDLTYVYRHSKVSARAVAPGLSPRRWRRLLPATPDACG
ncbi:MAG: SGNH/GDSL hydrolase family protein [Solirubrobacteraceae bacterium]